MPIPPHAAPAPAIHLPSQTMETALRDAQSPSPDLACRCLTAGSGPSCRPSLPPPRVAQIFKRQPDALRLLLDPGELALAGGILGLLKFAFELHDLLVGKRLELHGSYSFALLTLGDPALWRDE